MPMSSADSNETPHKDAGFSLVEVLAVIAIISLMAGAIVISLPRGASPMDLRTAQLQDLLQARLDAAAMAGEMRALRINEDGLELLRDDGVEMVSEAEFSWPEDARVRVRVDDEDVELTEDTDALLWVEPYGEVPDMALEFSGVRQSYTLTFDERGRVARSDGR